VADRISKTSLLSNSTLISEALEEWNISRTGPLTDIANNNLVWGRLPPNSTFADPSAGPNSPHWELLPSIQPGPSPVSHVEIDISLVSPASRK
jgi:choline dehydrogenase